MTVSLFFHQTRCPLLDQHKALLRPSQNFWVYSVVVGWFVSDLIDYQLGTVLYTDHTVCVKLPLSKGNALEASADFFESD